MRSYVGLKISVVTVPSTDEMVTGDDYLSVVKLTSVLELAGGFPPTEVLDPMEYTASKSRWRPLPPQLFLSSTTDLRY